MSYGNSHKYPRKGHILWFTYIGWDTQLLLKLKAKLQFTSPVQDQAVREYDEENAYETIQFFSTIKPCFTVDIDYTLVYHYKLHTRMLLISI